VQLLVNIADHSLFLRVPCMHAESKHVCNKLPQLCTLSITAKNAILAMYLDNITRPGAYLELHSLLGQSTSIGKTALSIELLVGKTGVGR